MNNNVTLLFEPCAPLYLGSLFLNCESRGVLPTQQSWYILRFLLPILDFYNITTFITAGMFYMFNVYLPSVYCLLRYTDFLLKTKSYQSLIYKRLEVLERLLNDYGRRRIIPAVMIIVPVIEITSISTIIKTHGEIQLPGLLIFSISFLSTFSALALLGTVSGRLRGTSEDLLHSWRSRGNSKYYRRQVISLQPLTARFGNNLTDKDTTLVTQDFCAGQTASLLMLK